MKNSELRLMGVQELNPVEMQETDGGVVLIILGVCAAVLALSSCINGPVTIRLVLATPIQLLVIPKMSADSSKLEIPIDVPIGY
ncbi:MAG: hypothetical protein IPH69_15590 [Bacteroidales bacterium]|nr:hypothetical protein [Bacteroidales bacterium]